MTLKFDTTRAEGVENGVRWVTKDAPMYGAVNGYARLPEGHPWRDKELQMDDYDLVDVHGGITYGPDADGWIGFDTLHAFDVWPGSPDYQKDDEYGRWWTPDMVAEEARQLAIQIAKAMEEVA